MAHTTRAVQLGNTAVAQVTFTSYTAGAGGEQFTLAEFGLTGSLQNVWFIETRSAQGTALPAAALVQYVGAGKVMIVTGPDPTLEIPTTPSMNFTVFCIVQGS